jgi:hypothetical protein
MVTAGPEQSIKIFMCKAEASNNHRFYSVSNTLYYYVVLGNYSDKQF